MNRSQALMVMGLDEPIDNKILQEKFHALSLQLHPDRGGDQEKYKEITQAYAILSGRCASTSEAFAWGEEYTWFDSRSYYNTSMYEMMWKIQMMNAMFEQMSKWTAKDYILFMLRMHKYSDKMLTEEIDKMVEEFERATSKKHTWSKRRTHKRRAKSRV